MDPALASFTFDGKEVPIHDGDTFASALHRAGILELSRSMKYHRPRGAYCFSGGCAGCLVDIDGTPNRLACMEPASPAALTSQNRIGSAKRDLLSVTDRVYPKGFDPHGAFTKPRILNKVFLKAVRFMSGVGKVPDAPVAPARRHQHLVDEIIIGAGSRGRARAQKAKGDVLLVDEHHADVEGVTCWSGALAFGIYDDVVAVRHRGDLHEVRAKRITIATGSHDGWPLFPGNDRPGVMSQRGALRLLSHQVLPGKRIVVHGTPAPALIKQVRDLGGDVVAHGEVDAVAGNPRVERARIGEWIRCDAVVCDVPSMPRIELLQQAGCTLHWQDGRLVPLTDRGRTSRKDIHWEGA